MTRPVFSVDPGTLDALRPGDRTELTGSEGHHARTVRRLGPGEPLDLVDGRGHRASCAVVETTDEGLLLTVLEPTSAEAGSGIVLVQALAKQDRDLQAVEMGTELGIDAVIPWQADRSIVRWKPERARKAWEKWENTVRAATKQSRRARVPEVAGLHTTAQLCAEIGPEDVALVLHEQATQGLAETIAELKLASRAQDAGRLLVVVGPEGGISEQELDRLQEAGARPVLVGHHVLRSSTAGAAAIAALHALTGAWG